MKTTGKMIRACAPVVPLLLWAPGPALAHHFMDGGLPQTFVQGLLSGLGHPLIGLDHAIFIIAAGFLLALVPGGLWGIAALIAGSLAGAALHLFGLDLPGGEIGVAAAAWLAHRRLIATRESWAAPLATLLGTLAGSIGMAFLYVNLAV